MELSVGTYKSSYYIKPSQVTLMANDQNNPSLVYVGVRSGTYVEIYYTDRTGATLEQVIGYGPNSSYQKWQLSGSSTKLASNAKHYIYIRLRRTEKTAMLIFSTRLYDFYGKNVDGVNHAANRELYYYILAGELTATDGTSSRELTFQTGNLSTPENSYDKEEADSKFLSFEIADQRYLNQVEDDTAKGIITFLQGIKIGSWEGENTAHSFQLRYDETLDSVVLSRTDGKPAHFLATGALSTRALGNIEEEGTGGGMDYVYNEDDFLKALDTFNKVSETDTFNAYAIRSLYEKVKKIENSSTDTSYVDGKIEDVNKKIDTNTAYLSEWIRRTEETLQGNIDAVESTLQENIDTVAGDLSTLQTTVNDFLTGTDTDTIINRWKELEAFLAGYTETATLADLLSGKADKATTLAGYGITNAYTKTEVDSKITSVNTGLTTLQTTVSGHTTSINSLQSTVSGHTSSITSINSKITTLQGYFTNGVAKSALRLSDGAEYKAWGQVFFKDGKPVNVSGAGTFTQVNADSVLFGGKARLAYDSTLDALLLTKDDGTVVHFLASGAVATRGLGEIEEGGGGTGTGVDLLNVSSDIIPIVGGTYSLGSSANAWKMIYANGGAIGNTYIDSSRVIFGTYIQGQSWAINPDGSASLGSITSNGEPVATRNWVNSQDFAKASDLTSINNSISSLQASTFTGANAPEGKGYTLTWFTQSGGGRNVTIPAYGELGTVATDGLAGIGQNVALVDQWLIADLMDYIAEVAAGGNVDLSNYVTLNSAQTISGMKTFTGGITASRLYSVEYLDSSELIINAEKVNFIYDGDDADVQIGLINGYKPLTLGNTSFSPALSSGTVIGTITIGGESKTIYAPSSSKVDLSNYVTLDGEQTITGSKYFSDLNANSIYLQGFELKPYNPDNATPDRLMYDGYVLLDEYNYKDYLVGDLDILAKGLQESSPLYDLSYLDYIRNYVSGKNLSVVVYNQNSESESINAASVALNVGNSANRVFRLISYKWGDLYWQKGNGNGDGWDSMRTILDSSNYATTLDSAYVKKSGDTVTGKLGFTGSTYPHIYGNGAYLIIGASAEGSYGLTFDYSSHAIRPRANNDTALGISYVRWSNVYSVLGNFSGQITSTVADGTAPFVVASKTEVANLHSATATKLHTARTLWGQSFDGSGNVSGNLTEVGSITASNLLTLSSTNHDIYIKRGGADTAALYLGTANFRPFSAANGLLSLGASNARWNVIYGQSLDLSGNAIVSGLLGVKGVTPTICFYYNNATIRTALIQEISAGSLKFVGYNNPLTLLLDLQDATAKFYSVELEGSSVGREMVALQTSFDSQDPETSDRPTNHESRCNLLLQPRGGQVYVGYTPTDVQSPYALSVGQAVRLYGDANSTNTPEISFYRAGVSSWKIMNNGGNLIFQNNYTTVVQGSYFDVLKLNYNTGNATLKGSLTTGGNILPSVTKTLNLGQADKRWNVYAASLSAVSVTSSLTPDAVDSRDLGSTALPWYCGYIDYLSPKEIWFNDDEAYSMRVDGGKLCIQTDNLLIGTTSDAISNVANRNIYINGRTKIGFGTAVDNLPSEPVLSVSGQANMYGFVCGGEFNNYGDDLAEGYANWWIVPDGIAFFQTVENLSDATKKSVIGNVQLSISDIAAAPSIYFTWTEARRNKKARYVGTTAQYWNELLPELVNNNNGVLSLDYATLGVTLGINIAREVNTMKMWQTTTTDRIEELEDKVKKLEEENKALRELLNNN